MALLLLAFISKNGANQVYRVIGDPISPVFLCIEYLWPGFSSAHKRQVPNRNYSVVDRHCSQPDTEKSMTLDPLKNWSAAAEVACSEPGKQVRCPSCRAVTLRAEWSIADINSREADVSLACDSCSVAQQLRIVLPSCVPEFYPWERMFTYGEAFFEQITKLVQSVHQHERILPSATWMIHPGWLMAGWYATSYQWHPTSEAPPILGLTFENPEIGKELFQSWIDKYGHQDELEEIRISLIEGDIPGQDSGYSIHICPDPSNSLVRATAEGIALDMVPFTLLGQVRRMHPVDGESVALLRFKEEFANHQEFMLAPVERRADGKLWVIPELGIIKRMIQFRDISDIHSDDIDSLVFRMQVVPGSSPTS